MRVIFLIVIIFGSVLDGKAQDSLVIPLAPTEPHRFVFTNTINAFWYGNTQAKNSPSFMGYTIAEQRYVRDYEILVNNKPLPRNTAQYIYLYPDRIERQYDLMTETFWFVDSLPMLVISLKNSQAKSISVRFLWDAAVSNNLQWKQHSPFLLGKVPELIQRNKRAWVGIVTIPNKENLFNQGSAILQNESTTINLPDHSQTTILVYFGQDSMDVARIMLRAPGELEHWLKVRRQRIQRLLQRTSIHTKNEMFNRAVAWARIALDDLITHQGMPGIWAGLPWFNNYWGRDTFIAFRGALLTTGRFPIAKKILRAFAAGKILIHYPGNWDVFPIASL